MKVKAYMRVAKSSGSKGYRVSGSTRPNHAPLTDSRGNVQPTVAFAIVLDIPNQAFAAAEMVVAEVTVPFDAVTLPAQAVPSEEPARLSE